jgi:hypothetical protein
MASVTPDPNGISIDTITANIASQINGYAGVAIAAGQLVKMSGALLNGMPVFVLADGQTALAAICGMAATKAGVNNPVTALGKGVRVHYAAPATFVPGQWLYLDTSGNSNAGGLNTAATTGDALGVARAINDQDIRLERDYTSVTAG